MGCLNPSDAGIGPLKNFFFPTFGRVFCIFLTTPSDLRSSFYNLSDAGIFFVGLFNVSLKSPRPPFYY